ncbi:MAG: oligosaccharide repeat unit polymerase [Roseburia sp.]|nr:oligosaccharide repeat unit polymerase [Roseburia sp.]MCM1277888.1 oligosaccharide repeat unit polymerase [Robinsoniella sp.]
MKRVIPSTVFCAEWIFFIIAGSVLFYHEFTGFKGLIYILVCCFLFAFGERIGSNTSLISIKQFKSSQHSINLESAELLFFVGIIVEIILFIYTIRIRKYSFGSIASILAVSSMTRGREIEGGWFVKAGNVFVLSIMGIEGYMTAYSKCACIKRRSKFIYLFSGIALIGVFTTGKSMAIWAVLIWSSGWLTAANAYSFDYSLVWNYMKKNIKKIIFLGVLFLLLMGFMMYMRRQREVGKIVESLLIYAFGHIPVFSDWYYKIDNSELQYSIGRQMLYGLFSRTPWNEGLSENFSLLLECKVQSNIFTVFRSIIEDFGKMGGFLFWSVLGIFTGKCQKRIEMYKNSYWAIAFVMSTYFFIFMSFIISAWHYYATLCAFLLIWLELIFVEKFHWKLKKKNEG